MKLMTIWCAYNESLYKTRDASSRLDYAIRMGDIHDINQFAKDVDRRKRQRRAFAWRMVQRLTEIDKQ